MNCDVNLSNSFNFRSTGLTGIFIIKSDKIDLFTGTAIEAEFTDRDTLSLPGQQLAMLQAVVASGK